MEQFATFLFKATHGRNNEFYSHTSAEVYFNKVVAIVEEKAKAILGQDPFSDNWQSKKCEELVRAFVRNEENKRWDRKRSACLVGGSRRAVYPAPCSWRIL